MSNQVDQSQELSTVTDECPRPAQEQFAMSSEELNERIADIADEGDKFGFEAFGGKAIPYIGWFWRDVDFDRDSYTFGLMPAFQNSFAGVVVESNDLPRIGFMENNKWDYQEFYSTPEQSKRIRGLLEAAVIMPNEGTLRAVYDAIQSVNVPAPTGSAQDSEA